MNRRAIMEKYIKARIHEVDEKHLDPEQRAQLVNTFIINALGYPNGYPDPSTNNLHWDLTCFCVEFMNRFAQNIGAEPLLVAQKVISDLVYNLHYDVNTKSEALGPGRDEEEKVWVERIEEQKRIQEGLRQVEEVENMLNDKLAEEGKDSNGV